MTFGNNDAVTGLELVILAFTVMVIIGFLIISGGGDGGSGDSGPQEIVPHSISAHSANIHAVGSSIGVSLSILC
jgi:hypothetical protein